MLPHPPTAMRVKLDPITVQDLLPELTHWYKSTSQSQLKKTAIFNLVTYYGVELLILERTQNLILKKRSTREICAWLRDTSNVTSIPKVVELAALSRASDKSGLTHKSENTLIEKLIQYGQFRGVV